MTALAYPVMREGMVSQEFKHRGAQAQTLIADVTAAEAKAVIDLGGPVVRSHIFINKGQDVIFTWTRKAANGEVNDQSKQAVESA